jgi:transcriptional regulator with XRE-family HTH domain
VGPVAEQPAHGLGSLLRRLRADAGLTQEELAGRARVSPRTISDLERGVSATARASTARLLADASVWPASSGVF